MFDVEQFKNKIISYVSQIDSNYADSLAKYEHFTEMLSELGSNDEVFNELFNQFKKTEGEKEIKNLLRFAGLVNEMAKRNVPFDLLKNEELYVNYFEQINEQYQNILNRTLNDSLKKAYDLRALTTPNTNFVVQLELPQAPQRLREQIEQLRKEPEDLANKLSAPFFQARNKLLDKLVKLSWRIENRFDSEKDCSTPINKIDEIVDTLVKLDEKGTNATHEDINGLIQAAESAEGIMSHYYSWDNDDVKIMIATLVGVVALTVIGLALTLTPPGLAFSVGVGFVIAGLAMMSVIYCIAEISKNDVMPAVVEQTQNLCAFFKPVLSEKGASEKGPESRLELSASSS